MSSSLREKSKILIVPSFARLWEERRGVVVYVIAEDQPIRNGSITSAPAATGDDPGYAKLSEKL
jgi:hypothetical protein